MIIPFRTCFRIDSLLLWTDTNHKLEINTQIRAYNYTLTPCTPSGGKTPAFGIPTERGLVGGGGGPLAPFGGPQE